MAAGRELQAGLTGEPAREHDAAPRRGPRIPRLLRHLLLCCVAFVVVIASGLLVLQAHLVGQVHRIDRPFEGLDGRPGERAPGAVDVLILTTDRTTEPALRGAVAAPAWLPRARHVDSAHVLHLDASRRAAAVLDVPDRWWRASLTPGPSALVASVERSTGVRVDHLAAFEWSGYERLADLGDPVRLVGPRGRHTVNGRGALRYVAEPAAGSRAQTRRELVLLRELMFDTLHTSMRHDPWLLFRTLDVVTEHLTVESGWSAGSMRNLVISSRNLRSAAIAYVPAPDEGTWAATAEDTITSRLASHPRLVLPDDAAS